MYTAGLVARLGRDRDTARDALDQLNAAGPFTLGERDGDFVSLALEAENPQEARHWHDWAEALPGVRSLEVVFVHWNQEDQETSDERLGIESA